MSDDIFSCLDTMNECDWQIGGRINISRQLELWLRIAQRSKNPGCHTCSRLPPWNKWNGMGFVDRSPPQESRTEAEAMSYYTSVVERLVD